MESLILWPKIYLRKDFTKMWKFMNWNFEAQNFELLRIMRWWSSFWSYKRRKLQKRSCWSKESSYIGLPASHTKRRVFPIKWLFIYFYLFLFFLAVFSLIKLKLTVCLKQKFKLKFLIGFLSFSLINKKIIISFWKSINSNRKILNFCLFSLLIGDKNFKLKLIDF